MTVHPPAFRGSSPDAVDAFNNHHSWTWRAGKRLLFVSDAYRLLESRDAILPCPKFEEDCPPALGGPHLHERPRAQPVLPIGQAGGEGAHARHAARHVDAYLHSGGALHPATTTLSTGYRACSRAAGWSARLCALPHLLPRGVAGVRPLSQSGHSPSWPCPKKWHFSDMAALADDVRCRGNTVAKVPKKPCG
jgi:hypothetical protein